MSQQDVSRVYELLTKLCEKLALKNQGAALSKCTKFLTKQPIPQTEITNIDENALILKISNHIGQTKSSHAGVTMFMQLYESLSSKMELEQRKIVLSFLIALVHDDSAPPFTGFSTPSSHSSNVYPKIAKKPSFIPTSSSSESINFLLKSQKSVPSSQSIIGGSIYNQISTTSTPVGNECLANGEIMDELIQDVLYSFVGVQGKYLRKDIITGGFRLDPKSAGDLSVINSGMLLRLTELGFYYDQIKLFTDKESFRYPIGLLGQGLVTALNRELTDYYGIVAAFQEQFNKQRQVSNNVDVGDRLTLMKLMVWSSKPLHRLQRLYSIAEACQDKKGGALASAVYEFNTDGDPIVKQLARELLVSICHPLQTMLAKWLLEGEIEDPYSEFFIEMLPEIGSDRLWHDKYRIKENLLPNFIPRQIAKKIFVTGKSINYLREVCHETTPIIAGREEFKQLILSNSEDDLIACVPDTKLHMMIEAAYLNTSKRVLDNIMGSHKLLEHLQAMRRYLLLGQGDFIGLLMEQLKPELDRPAKDLYRHNLASIMDSAVRATNAQYEDLDILNHLDVKLVDSFHGDSGWDVFTLCYSVRGPLLPILEPAMTKYNILFKFLWKVKHIEFVLTSKIWKQQKCNEKLLRSMAHLMKPIAHRLNLYTSDMIHFINQMQYYILFEVLECAWATFLKQVQTATALDDILEAHEHFLANVHSGITFEGNSCTSLNRNLTQIFNGIMDLESWQDIFYETCHKEFEAQREFDREIVESEERKEYGVTVERRLERDNEAKIFEYSLSECLTSLSKIVENYQFYVRQFLLVLASSNDNKLQQFGIRLDFNEYYKKGDQQLGQKLTLGHMRMSAMSNSLMKSSGVSLIPSGQPITEV